MKCRMWTVTRFMKLLHVNITSTWIAGCKVSAVKPYVLTLPWPSHCLHQLNFFPLSILVPFLSQEKDAHTSSHPHDSSDQTTFFHYFIVQFWHSMGTWVEACLDAKWQLEGNCVAPFYISDLEHLPPIFTQQRQQSCHAKVLATIRGCDMWTRGGAVAIWPSSKSLTSLKLPV